MRTFSVKKIPLVELKYLKRGGIMLGCTFFGHRDCPQTIRPKLRERLIYLITNHGVDMFYVGHQYYIFSK